MTHPSGFVLTYNYASGLNGRISRLSSLSDSTGTSESYDLEKELLPEVDKVAKSVANK